MLKGKLLCGNLFWGTIISLHRLGMMWNLSVVRYATIEASTRKGWIDDKAFFPLLSDFFYLAWEDDVVKISRRWGDAGSRVSRELMTLKHRNQYLNKTAVKWQDNKEGCYAVQLDRCDQVITSTDNPRKISLGLYRIKHSLTKGIMNQHAEHDLPE